MCPYVEIGSFPYNYSSVQFSHSVASDSLWPRGLQHAKPSCPSPAPSVYSNSCPLSWWCHSTISSSVVLFSSCLQSFPASGSFQMSQFFASGRWCHTGLGGHNSNGLLKGERFRDMYTSEWRSTCDDKVRDRSDEAASRGKLRIASNQQKLGKVRAFKESMLLPTPCLFRYSTFFFIGLFGFCYWFV